MEFGVTDIMLIAGTEELPGSWLMLTGDTADGSSALTRGNSVFEEEAEVALDIVVDVEVTPENINGCLTGVVRTVVAALGFRPRLVPPLRFRPRVPKMGRAIVDVL